MTGPNWGAQKPIILDFDPGWQLDDMTIRVSLDAEDDLRELLARAGFQVGEVIELSDSPELLTTIAAMIGTGGVGAWLGPMIKDLVGRKRDRKFRVQTGDDEIELNGYSPDEIERIVKMVEGERQKRVKAAEERRRQDPDT